MWSLLSRRGRLTKKYRNNERWLGQLPACVRLSNGRRECNLFNKTSCIQARCKCARYFGELVSRSVWIED